MEIFGVAVTFRFRRMEKFDSMFHFSIRLIGLYYSVHSPFHTNIIRVTNTTSNVTDVLANVQLISHESSQLTGDSFYRVEEYF